MKKLILAGIVFGLMAATAFAEIAQTPDLTSAAYGARPMGMGGACVALSDDTNSIFVNPAGLAYLKKWSVTSMSTQLLQRVDYKLAGGTYKIGPGTLGVGYVNASSPAGYKCAAGSTPDLSSPIVYNNTMVLVSYGLNLGNVMKVDKSMGALNVGATAKLISKDFQGLDGASASGVDIDLGCSVRPSNSPFSYGAAIKNLNSGGSAAWNNGTKENLEGSTKAGVAAKLFGEGGLFKFLSGDLVTELDIEILSAGKPMVFHAGAEYKLSQNLAVRLGLDQAPLSKSEASNSLTAGVGMSFGSFAFDYAYRMNPDASELSNHYFSLSFIPEESKAEKEAKTAEETKNEGAKTDEIKYLESSSAPKEGKKTDEAYKLSKEYEDIYRGN